jgi:hypothetical protein
MSLGKTKKKKQFRNKKQQQGSQKKKALPPPETEIPTWDQIAKYPPVLFNTLGRGVIIGFLGGANDTMVRIYAPAAIQEAPPSNILFLPIFPVEHFMDLRQACIFSSSPIPKILAEGYLGYFEQFAKGNYRMKPVVINGAIDAPEGAHTVEDSPSTPSPEAPKTDPLQAVPEEPAPEETASEVS